MSQTAWDWNRSRRLSVAVAMLAALALAVSTGAMGTQTGVSLQVPESIDSALTEIRDGIARIIVQKWNPQDASAERGVRRLGGTITRDLPIVDGFSASIPPSSIDSLARLEGARVVTLDRRTSPQEVDNPNNVKSVFSQTVKANKMWSAGYSGAGVTVALIDTGVADVADLAGRVLPVYDDITNTYSPCLNLSGESHCGDSYGHGTFMAGIIAGNGASSGGQYKGVAPQANIVSVKTSGADGSADVSTILAAIQWVVSFKDTYGIRVMNLSLGTDGTQTYRTDPFNYAVERAWASGIVVVVSASNDGPSPQTISKPGDDPWVITVGATDDRGTPGLGDDELPDFSSRGPTAADFLPKPDLTAPGAHVVSLRAPGSSIDTLFPNYIDGSYRKGSGTSMSAAVVSGSVALMLQASPAMAPDRVKFALMSTASNAASNDAMEVGAGVPHIYNATFSAPAGLANQGLDRSSGMGSLDLSRGSVRVSADDPLSTVVSADLTLQLLLWDQLGYTSLEWTGSKWYGSKWFGSKWFGSKWYGSKWFGSKWFGSKWYGTPDGSKWFGNYWDGSKWYGAWE